METGRYPAVGTLRFFATTIILAVAALVTRRALGLPRCFRSLGELCPEASAGCACRRTAAVVGALDFARCYRSLRALSPSRPPLLGGQRPPLRWVPGQIRPLRYSIAA